ncbi:MAG: cytidine deaminase [Candidatus Marinimicrobia bacterium]|nr:cytidine deaminase [Candidatus Neomarinimicrobiota bacterium]MBL7022591.1 cytidine deaminase [Candidatus Neomarinimicrobiota bacterium]MBL7109874.1 cytidine deaminase [Candidatus Neomarinimicrobiota bacterium]
MKPEKLIQSALKAQNKSVSPFSKYPVGVALLTENGDIIHGCNIESKAYPTTLCAERVAIFSAIAQGYNKFKAMAIVTKDGGMPCGACRQIISEFAGNIPLYVGNSQTNYKTTTIDELLPYPF